MPYTKIGLYTVPYRGGQNGIFIFFLCDVMLKTLKHTPVTLGYLPSLIKILPTDKTQFRNLTDISRSICTDIRGSDPHGTFPD